MSYGYDHSKDGGPAFPISLPGWGDNGAGGMTLRDWFAGQAFPVMLTQLYAMAAREGAIKNLYQVASEASYEAADALLAAREVAK